MNKFFNTLELYPKLELIKDYIQNIKLELSTNLDKWTEWCESILQDENNGWKVIPIYGFNNWTKESENFKYLKEFITKINENNEVKLVIISKLESDTVLEPHKGWGSHSNFVIRNHYGIEIPENCGIWVEGEKKNHIQDEWISFDDSKSHSAYNLSEKNRIVLIMDITRPTNIPLGTSQAKCTKELECFINFHKK
jgi:hypothetical protein